MKSPNRPDMNGKCERNTKPEHRALNVCFYSVFLEDGNMKIIKISNRKRDNRIMRFIRLLYRVSRDIVVLLDFRVHHHNGKMGKHGGPPCTYSYVISCSRFKKQYTYVLYDCARSYVHGYVNSIGKKQINVITWFRQRREKCTKFDSIRRSFGSSCVVLRSE